MPNTTLNLIKDVTAVLKVCLYRTFWEHNWSTPQPMFNIVDVVEGMETTFEAFLAEGQSKGAENNSYYSFGPYRVTNSSTLIFTACETLAGVGWLYYVLDGQLFIGGLILFIGLSIEHVIQGGSLKPD